MKGLTWKQLVEDIRFDELENIVIGDLDFIDFPDFCDAFIESACYKGVELGEDDLNYLQDKFGDEVNQYVHENFQFYV